MSKPLLWSEAERDAANAVHQRRGRLHRRLCRGEVRRNGYCFSCVGDAVAAIEAACDDHGRLRTVRTMPVTDPREPGR